MANSPARSTIDVGSVIAATYTIEALIGRGGMGSVFLASHNRLPGKKVAIKLLHTDSEHQETFARFKHEAEIASRLGHPNIVTVHDFNVTADGTPYIVLEYLHGESLGQRLRDGPVPVPQVLSIVRQVGSALAAAHLGGIVHRDLKPQNIFLVPTEVDGRIVEIAKVLDFGISKMRGSQTVKTQESTLLGTPQYMAPEQAKGEHTSVDARTDVFAFGAIIYEMLAGHPAFAGESIPEVVFRVVYETPLPLAKQAPNTPPAIVAAVERAMAKTAADRFPTVSDLVEAITGEAVSLRRVPSLGPANVGFPTGSRVRSTGQEAYDQTMGSQDHGGDVPVLSSELRPATLGAAVHAAAPTIASNATVVLPSDSRSAAPPRRSPIAILLVALTTAAVVVAVMYFVMRSPAGTVANPDAAVAVVTSDAASTRTSEPSDAAVPVADAVVAIVVADATLKIKKAPLDPVATAKRTGGRVVTAPDEPPSADDQGLGEIVSQAESALKGGDFDLATRLANRVINARGTAQQNARAHGVRGAVQCASHNNEERALIDLRAIPSQFASSRQMLLGICHSHGLLTAFQ